MNDKMDDLDSFFERGNELIGSFHRVQIETTEQKKIRQASERKGDIKSMLFGKYKVEILKQFDLIETKTDENARSIEEFETGEEVNMPTLSFDTEKSLIYAALMNDDTERPQEVRLNAKGQTALFYIINPEIAGRVDTEGMASCQDTEMITEVLSSGIDPMIKDVHGKDCLDYGADEHQVGMIVDWTFRTRNDVVDREEFTDWWQEKLDKCNKDVNYH